MGCCVSFVCFISLAIQLHEIEYNRGATTVTLYLEIQFDRYHRFPTTNRKHLWIFCRGTKIHHRLLNRLNKDDQLFHQLSTAVCSIVTNVQVSVWVEGQGFTDWQITATDFPYGVSSIWTFAECCLICGNECLR